MQQHNPQTISQGFWRLVPVLVGIAAIVLYVLQLRVDFQLYQQLQQQQLATHIKLVEPAVKQAISRNDAQLSRQLISQLLEQPFISHASISTSQHMLANAPRSNDTHRATFPTSLFVETVSEQERLLVSAATGRAGKLVIGIDNHQRYQAFYQQALKQLGLFFAVALILILAIRSLLKKRLEHPWQDLNQTRDQHQQQLSSCQTTLSNINHVATFGSWHYSNNRFHWQGELANLLGLESTKLTNSEDIIACVADSHRERLHYAIANASSTGDRLDMELPLQHQDSTQLWIRAVGHCQLVDNQPKWVEGVLLDVSDTHSSQHDLQLRDFALNQSPDSIFTLDSSGCILSVNDTACRVFGYTRDEMVGQTVDLLNRKFDMSGWPRWWKMVKNQHHHTSFAENQSKTGHQFPVEVAASYFSHNQHELCILSVKDITERKKQQDVIQHLAYHDSLTNLPNRRLLLDRLQQALVSANRHQHIGALLFIDLDNFKKINDSQGHSGGDQVLKTLAERITNHLRSEDTVARIGGDEFVVLLPYLSNNLQEAKQRAKDLAGKLLSLVTRPIDTEEQPLQVTASIGVVNFPNRNENDAEKLISFADTAMYQAKEKGRNGVVYFEMSMADDVSRRINLEGRLRTALESDELYLNFQPQYKGLQQLVGAEVLLRWEAPDYGLISPAEFVPILESSGLILEVGEWVMRQACLQLKQWIDMDLWDDNLTLGVNISPVEFEQPEFVDRVARILDETGVPPHNLDIEITEGTVINNIEQIIKTLSALRALGVKISIDDFGTGYSSLTYLKRLPIDMVKIDQSFVKDIPGDDSAGAIISTIISMAKHLKLEIIAEGIESIEQIHYLEANGCQKFQGFYFQAPISETEFISVLQDDQQNHRPRLSSV